MGKGGSYKSWSLKSKGDYMFYEEHSRELDKKYEKFELFNNYN